MYLQLILIVLSILKDHDPKGTIYSRLHQIIDWTRRHELDSASVPSSSSPSASTLSSTSGGLTRGVVIAVCGSLFAAADVREELFRINPNYFAVNDWVRDSDNLL